MNQTSKNSVESRTWPAVASFLRHGAVLKDSLAALPRPVWILCAGTFLNRFGGFVIPFLALYMKRQGFSLAQISLALVAYGAGHFIATALGGYLADRIGRRNTIILSMLGAAVAMLALAQARRLEWIVVWSGVVGLVGEFYRPACGALLADLVPAGRRVTAFAAYRLAINAGWAFGPAAAGLLAEHSFFWLFIGDAITSALFGAVAWVALPHGLRSQGEQSPWWTPLVAAARDKRFVQLLIATLGVALIFFQMSSTFGLYIEHLGYTTATYGLLISLNGLLVVLCELPLTMLTQRLPIRKVIATGYALIGIGFALIGFVSTIPALALALVIFTIGEMISMPVAAAYLADLAPPEYRGRYLGFFGFTWSSALLVGPGLGMVILNWSPFWLWTGCGLLGVLAAAIILPNNGAEH